jgi:hypothetical protein
MGFEISKLTQKKSGGDHVPTYNYTGQIAISHITRVANKADPDLGGGRAGPGPPRGPAAGGGQQGAPRG